MLQTHPQQSDPIVDEFPYRRGTDGNDPHHPDDGNHQIAPEVRLRDPPQGTSTMYRQTQTARERRAALLPAKWTDHQRWLYLNDIDRLIDRKIRERRLDPTTMDIEEVST